jgi:hypothetical protein
MQVFRTCILPTPGGAIPKSGVARRERPPPPRITLRIQPDPDEITSPPTPHGSPEGSLWAGAAAGLTLTAGNSLGSGFSASSGSTSTSEGRGSREEGVAGLDEDTLQLFLEHVYEPEQPVAQVGRP